MKTKQWHFIKACSVTVNTETFSFGFNTCVHDPSVMNTNKKNSHLSLLIKIKKMFFLLKRSMIDTIFAWFQTDVNAVRNLFFNNRNWVWTFSLVSQESFWKRGICSIFPQIRSKIFSPVWADLTGFKGFTAWTSSDDQNTAPALYSFLFLSLDRVSAVCALATLLCFSLFSGFIIFYFFLTGWSFGRFSTDAPSRSSPLICLNVFTCHLVWIKV